MTETKIAYSLDEAAALASVSERTLRREIAAQRLASTKKRRRRLIPRESLMRWINDPQNPSPAPA
jgi:excisionase family DNA binding protein